ncbi:unnamed protein product, partial [Amoebophrya sp. A120]|eukprot:GSA120T00025461001.1
MKQVDRGQSRGPDPNYLQENLVEGPTDGEQHTDTTVSASQRSLGINTHHDEDFAPPDSDCSVVVPPRTVEEADGGGESDEKNSSSVVQRLGRHADHINADAAQEEPSSCRFSFVLTDEHIGTRDFIHPKTFSCLLEANCIPVIWGSRNLAELLLSRNKKKTSGSTFDHAEVLDPVGWNTRKRIGHEWQQRDHKHPPPQTHSYYLDLSEDFATLWDAVWYFEHFSSTVTNSTGQEEHLAVGRVTDAQEDHLQPTVHLSDLRTTTKRKEKQGGAEFLTSTSVVPPRPEELLDAKRFLRLSPRIAKFTVCGTDEDEDDNFAPGSSTTKASSTSSFPEIVVDHLREEPSSDRVAFSTALYMNLRYKHVLPH